jgi:predicted nucleic acid-binding protein
VSVKVVDASALGALLFGEPAAEEVAAAIGDSPTSAPSLLEYELGNVCWKKCQRHPEMADALRNAFAALPELAIQLHDVDSGEVLRLALRHRLTFYDASYVWLARALGAPLVTLDTRLRNLN